ncbi:MAG: DEAD/DEAH box helicase [Alphaproteobacteria bacterium]
MTMPISQPAADAVLETVETIETVAEETSNPSGFAALGLDAALVNTLTELTLTTPTEVQARAIPAVLDGRDVMASAPTGTGKTAAFVLPALQLLHTTPAHPEGHGPRVLVLTPTRELAQQVVDNIRKLGRAVRLKSAVVVGGVTYGPQLQALRNPLDLLVATPGRLIDHLNDGKVDFRRIDMVILDEADKMLDMGFSKPVEQLLQAIEDAGQQPQMLLFSATFTKAVTAMAARALHEPVKIELAKANNESANIAQKAIRADSQEHKLAMLKAMLEKGDIGQAIVFSATKHGADKLADKLTAGGFPSAALHGGMKQNARSRTLDQLHRGSVKLLVATDVAARGIDVKGLSHVINFDMPQVAEDYVHRIGRTGRAGETGIAISLVAPSDVPMLRDIEKLLKKPMELASMEGFEPKTDELDFLRAGAAAPRSRRGQGRTGVGGGAGRGGPRRDGGSFGGGRGRSGGGERSGGGSRPRRY